MNKNNEEKILKSKIELIDNEQNKLQNQYNLLYEETINKRNELEKMRSSLKINEVDSELRKINRGISKCNKVNKSIQKLKILRKSPYFAYVKFNNEDYYIGKFGFQNKSNGKIEIFDWRAPVSSLFYDFEVGKAFYIVPGIAKIEGEIQNKKQYKIVNSNLVYCFETNINIEDEILQKTLAENSSESMKTIVASIQKEQNAIIRIPKDESIIVQGVAGSGKTSIALHRIAYLLYNNKKDMQSNNVLIFSPNKVFSSFISSVLPELGEKTTKETTFEELLNENFEGLVNFITRFENQELILKNNEIYKTHKIKTSLDFYNKLKTFLNDFLTKSFQAKAIKIKKGEFSKEQVIEFFSQARGNDFDEKIDSVASFVISILNVQSPLNFRQENSFKDILKSKLRSCLSKNAKNIVEIYNKFLKKNKMKGINIKGKISFDDAVNLLYIKNFIYGTRPSPEITHVVIDEVQDYSPTALSIIAKTYPCTKTVLGDLSQTIDNENFNNYLEYAGSILNCENNVAILKTNYRSTCQIEEFSKLILGEKSESLIKRSGDDVSIIKTCENSLFETLAKQIENLQKKYNSIAIITKNLKQAFEISKSLNINLISPKSKRFKSGVVATPAYLSKGLEFDAVIVCDASEKNFSTNLDKQQLYVACSRPLHSLTIIYTDKLTKFIKQKKNW